MHYVDSSTITMKQVSTADACRSYKHQEAPWKPKCQGLPKNLPVDYLHSLAEITFLYSMMSRFDITLISEELRSKLASQEGEIAESISGLEEQLAENIKRKNNLVAVIEKGGDPISLATRLNELTMQRHEIEQLMIDRRNELIDKDEETKTLAARTSIRAVAGSVRFECPREAGTSSRPHDGADEDG